jgi:hypothetical protein
MNRELHTGQLLCGMLLFVAVFCVSNVCAQEKMRLPIGETVLGYIEKDNPKAKGTDAKSFIDDSLLREIEASGFVKTLYQK